MFEEVIIYRRLRIHQKALTTMASGEDPLINPGENRLSNPRQSFNPRHSPYRSAEDDYPRVTQFTLFLNHRSVKYAVTVIWVALAIGGLLSFKPFMANLKSEVPPVEGTPSYDASNMMAEKFPVSNLQIAVASLLTTAPTHDLAENAFFSFTF